MNKTVSPQILAPSQQGLYDPQFEHDACGVGFIVHKTGKQSHSIVEQGLTILLNLDHRGACGCEPNTGDGAGILMQVPHKFLQKVASAENITLPDLGQYGVGNIYSSPDRSAREEGRRIFEQITLAEGLTVLGWRIFPPITAVWAIRQRQVNPLCSRCLLLVALN